MSEPVRDVIIKINEAPASKVEEIYWGIQLIKNRNFY